MILRSAWEEPLWRIAEHTTSPPVNPADIRYIVIHYQGDSALPTTTLVQWHRNAQRAYVTTRGYSLGYSYSAWPTGDLVEIRGWDFRAASNDVPTSQERDNDGVPTNENKQTISCLVLSDRGSPANYPQVEAVRSLVSMVRARCGWEVPIIGHQDLEATGCPGPGIYAQVNTGTFAPVPPQQPQEDDMSEYLVSYPRKPINGVPPAGWVLCRMVGTEIQHIAGPLGKWLPTLEAQSSGHLDIGDAQAFVQLVQRCRPVGAPPDNAPDAVKAAWDARNV